MKVLIYGVCGRDAKEVISAECQKEMGMNNHDDVRISNLFVREDSCLCHKVVSISVRQ